MDREFSGFMSKVKGKAATLARRRFQASLKKYYNQSPSSLSQSVSPKESAAWDESDIFDPRAMAIKPTHANSRSRPTRTDSSEDFVSPKPKKSKQHPEKGQKKMSDFFSKTSLPSPEVSPDPKSPNESVLDDFTDQLSMARIGESICTRLDFQISHRKARGTQPHQIFRFVMVLNISLAAA